MNQQLRGETWSAFKWRTDPEHRKRAKASHRRWQQKNKARLAKKRRDKYASDAAHREKVKEYNHRRYRENKTYRQRILDRQLERTYGITRREFVALLKKQGGRCAVCRTKRPGGRGWHTEHDHQVGGVRGITCGLCNVGMGNLKDDPRLLERAAKYIRDYRKGKR